MAAKCSTSWKQYLSWLKKSAPKLLDGLAPVAKEADLAALEQALGAPLPASVRESWAHCGGQTRTDGAGIAAGFVVLSPAEALREWKSWDELRRTQGEQSLEQLSLPCTSWPDGAIRDEYSVAGWLPLWKERFEGNYLGVDLAPGPEGHIGQVINFGRDEDEKVVLFWDLADLVAWVAAEAKSGRLAVEEDEGLQHVEHASGRLIGVLTKLAKAGAIPSGPGPKPVRSPASSAANPATAPAPGASREIVPDPPAPLAAAARAILDRILERLRAHVPDASTSPAGYWQFSISDPEKPKGSYGGSVLLLDKPAVVDGRARKDGIDQDFVALCQASLEAGTPLKQIEVRYSRDGHESRLEVALETGANHKKLEKARRPLDLKVTAMLHEYAGRNLQSWDRLSFSFDDVKGKTELFLLRVVDGKYDRQRSPAPEEFQQIIPEVRALYGRFGRIVRGASWDARPNKVGKPDVSVGYG